MPKANNRISLKQYNEKLEKAEMRITNGQFTSHQELQEEVKIVNMKY